MQSIYHLSCACKWTDGVYVSVFNHFDCHAADNENVNYIYWLFFILKNNFFPSGGESKVTKGGDGERRSALDEMKLKAIMGKL